MTQNNETDWSAWNEWCDSRIRAALDQERQFMIEVVGTSLGETIAHERDALERKFADELQNLRTDLAQTQATLRSILAERNTPVEMPAPPTELA